MNASVLTLLRQFSGIDLLPAQLLAAEAAILNNFVLHNTWTYQTAAGENVGIRLLKFHLSMAAATAITLAVLGIGVSVFHLHYLVALAAGGLTALIWNYVMNKLVVWPPARRARAESSATQTATE